MRCPYCKSPVPLGSNHCLDCGKTISVKESIQPTTEEKVKTSPLSSGKKEKKGRSARLWSLLLLLMAFRGLLIPAVDYLLQLDSSADFDLDSFIFAVLEGDAEDEEAEADVSFSYYQDGSYDELQHYEDGTWWLFHYDRNGELSRREYYLSNGNIELAFWYENGYEVQADCYDEGEYLGSWYMEYENTDPSRDYPSCEYYIADGDTEWSEIAYFDNEYNIVGEASRDTETGEIIEVWGTDNLGNELAELLELP